MKSPVYRYELEVVDDANEELVYHGHFLSQETLEEKLYQVTTAQKRYEAEND